MGLRDLFRSKSNTPSAPQPSPGAPAQDPRAQDPRARETDSRAQGIPDADTSGQGTPADQYPQSREVNDREPGAGTDSRVEERPAQGSDVQQLPETGPLRNLVDILLSRGADRARLTLVQSGNVMTHQTRQAHGDAQDEVENGTVDQGSPLFDDVADLYTQAMNTPVGPWRQLDLAVTPEQDGRREVTVDYAFPSGQSRKESYVHGRPLSARGDGASDAREDQVAGDRDVTNRSASQGADRSSEVRADDARTDDTRDQRESAGAAGAGVAGAGLGAAAGAGAATGLNRNEDQRTTDQGVPHGASESDALSTRDSQERQSEDSLAERHATEGQDTDIESVRVVDGTDASPVADGQIVTKAESEPVVIPAGDYDQNGQAGLDTSAREQHSGQNEDPAAKDSARGDSDVDARGESADRDGQNASLDEQRADTDRSDESPRDDRNDLPEHVDESEFGGFTEPESPVAPTGAGAAALAADDDPADAPQVAQSTDVAPSYTAPSEQPSGDSLATGNLVLSLNDIHSRLGEAQRHLFGDGGTAREVSTVLIRVRALGTYYDALTHVRMNGFWDQRGTFDLVPENLLKVQELKDDSYVEGSGAPLAMMFRFRPGVPPEVSFDYSDEEAFVRYEQRLPGQNYLEELRMFPRTGANIPQHMNDALQDWNY